MSASQIAITAAGTFESVSLVGAAVEGVCRTLVSSSAAHKVELAVVEACNNIIEHAYKYDGTQEFTLIVALSEERIVCSLQYGGKPFPEDVELPENFEFDINDLDNLPEGGMGLFLMGQLMDTIEVGTTETGRNVLILTKNWQQNERHAHEEHSTA